MQQVKYFFYIIALFLLIFAPLYLDAYHLGLLGRFLALGILAMGISLVWGHTGILSLGQGLFFGLGGYMIAMHLKLESLPKGGIPDFMQWNGLNTLPWFWVPFQYGVIAIAFAIVIPMICAILFAWLVFHRRIGSVYFAIISQVLVLAATTFIISQQTYTGGFNGLTDFNTAFGFNLFNTRTQIGLYFFTVAMVMIVFILSQWLLTTPFGKLLHAIRDGENRIRYLGYNTSTYKVVIFAIGALFAAISGILFTLNIGIISPEMIGVVPSIEMVIWVAIGGRESLVGAILGTLLLNFSKDSISSTFPMLWPYIIGFAFIFIVTLLPKGLGGLFDRIGIFNKMDTPK